MSNATNPPRDPAFLDKARAFRQAHAIDYMVSFSDAVTPVDEDLANLLAAVDTAARVSALEHVAVEMPLTFVDRLQRKTVEAWLRRCAAAIPGRVPDAGPSIESQITAAEARGREAAWKSARREEG